MTTNIAPLAHSAATGHHVSWSLDGSGVCHTCGERFDPVVAMTVDSVDSGRLEVAPSSLDSWPRLNRRQRRADAARARRRR